MGTHLTLPTPKQVLPWPEKLKLALAIIGALSPVIAGLTFIGLKPEKDKELTWEYLSKNMMVDTGFAGGKIQVRMGNREVGQVTAVSGRLINSGGLPIESNDVKDGAWPTIGFGSRVLSVELKDRNRPGIVAKPMIDPSDDHTIKIEHGLLNSGDSVTFQILFEGDPGSLTNLPPVHYRISGIPDSVTIYPKLQPQSSKAQAFLVSSASIVVGFLMLCAIGFTFLAFPIRSAESARAQVIEFFGIRKQLGRAGSRFLTAAYLFGIAAYFLVRHYGKH